MKISYIKTENVKLNKLNEFQGNLKELSDTNFSKLWKSMQDSGFSEPFVVWYSTKEKKIYVIGGNQRLRVLNEKKKQGEDIPIEYPCNFVNCESKWAAKKLLLALASQYGHITDEGLYEFSIENEFGPDFLKENFEFPGLNLDLFIEGYFNDNLVQDNDINKEWKDMPEFEQNDIQSYHKIIIHFKDEEAIKDLSLLIKQNINNKTKFIWHPKLEIEHYGDVISK